MPIEAMGCRLSVSAAGRCRSIRQDPEQARGQPTSTVALARTRAGDPSRECRGTGLGTSSHAFGEVSRVAHEVPLRSTTTRRLVIYIVLFSTLVTFLITLAQLVDEYREGVADVRGKIVQISTLSLPVTRTFEWVGLPLTRMSPPSRHFTRSSRS